MRLPFAQPLTTRDGTLSKDSKILNGFIETKGDQSTVFKRPGTSLISSGLGGIGQGLISWNGSTQAIVSDTLNSISNSTTYGMTWTSRSLPSGANWHGIAWNGTVFCAISGYTSSSTAFATSPDGITWTPVTVTSGFWSDICWNGTVFCVIQGGGGSSSTCMTSPDGTTWTPHTMSAVADWRACTAGNGVIVAVANGATTASVSRDNGVTWTAGTLPSVAAWLGVSHNGSVFCAVAGATSNKAATSSDGITWVARTLPSSADWQSIAWNGTVFCTVSSSASTAAATSPDGVTWQARTLPSAKNWVGITWSGTVFCCVANGNNVAAVSADGITWASTTLSATASWIDCAFNGTNFSAIVFGATTASTGVLGTTTYSNTTTAINPTTTGLRYDMVPTAPSDANQYLMFKNTTEGFYYNGSSITKITDADYPASTVPGIAYLDSTFYVMDSTAKIYGSDLGNPASWTALNFIKAAIEPGNGVALAKSQNYVVAFKEWSTEFFYDNANPPPGSPLSPVLTNFTLIGCASGDSVAQLDKYTFWISQTRQRGRQVHLMVGDQQQPISNPDVERVLGNSTLSSVKAIGIRIAGHAFYCVSLVDLDKTLVYDVDNQTWYEWSSLVLNSASVSVSSITRTGTTALVTTSTAHGLSDGDPVKIAGAIQTAYNGIFQIRYLSTTSFYIEVSGSPATPATGTITATGYTSSYFKYSNYAFSNGKDFLLHATTGNLYQFLPSVYQDDGVPIDHLVRTLKFDGGTTNYKTMSQIELIGNKADDIALIRHSDDDYQTNSSYRLLNLGESRTLANRCGKFRRRSLEFRYTGNNGSQMSTFEMDVE